MKTRLIAKAMIAVTLAASFPAIAQDRGYDRGSERTLERSQDRGYDRARERSDDRRDRRDYRDYRDDRRDARRDYRDARRDDRRAYGDGGRGAGPRHDLYRGQRLPSNYHNRQYVVDNWQSHRLSAPPRGHHWVQVGNDYVLAAVATGLIASVLLGN
jgi:Ni/Co efflux regulator RcnB